MVKVERTYPAPSSLEKEKAKRNGSYREKDVIDKLKTDFNGKCYICNMGELADIEVEHLNPHKNGANLRIWFHKDTPYEVNFVGGVLNYNFNNALLTRV